ncbi:hypothetical protein [Fulvivirga ligni]|uniref:hypothetical protein n=1 Tax=Fulvivirga ligni TaxID=2904246 RepID=UPI001F2A47AA|nr:hypothetical protein [Fulvivirga ligni]UII20099.1 hypothetical protein LVD16_19830 [Fulvivirga ligni]
MKSFKFLLLAICFCLSVSALAQNNTKADQSDSVHLVLSFVIKKDGSLSKFKVKKMDCEGCSKATKESYEKEAIRVVKEKGPWNKPENPVRIVMPVAFKLNDIDPDQE